ncbi:RodZ domain-containing protein [Limnobacter sp.]|uniref:RodZ domain-containing protein n=1 Tax=Limnobacter sp. TaxID=2003368 RepID=UPI002FDF90B5
MNENRAMSKTESSDASAGQDVKTEQNNGSTTEKHPNLTLLESGQNPGEILRAARERAGYSLSDISAQTKINERQLEAIESGDVGRLPPETFAKAFIKSYCKALKLDAAPIILSFGFSESSAQAKVVRTGQGEAMRAEPLEPKMPSSSKRLSTLNFDRKTGKKSLSYGIVLAAVAVMAVFYIPVFLSNQATETSETEAAGDAIEPNDAPVAADTVEQSLPLPLDAPAADGDASSVFPALQQPQASAPPVAGSTSGTTPPVSTSEVAPTPPAAETPAASGAQSALRFKFQEQSWVTVRDSDDKVLISQLNDAGSSLEVLGQAPFKLIVGNAKSVEISSNGKPVDLSSSIRGEVARITIQ